MVSCSATFAAMNRFWLAAQHEREGKKGFYFNFENTSQGSAPCKLETLSLILGVGDITDRPKWELVTRMREANESAARERLGCAQGR